MKQNVKNQFSVLRLGAECGNWGSGMTDWHLGGQRLLEWHGATLEMPFESVDDEGVQASP